MAMSVEAVPSRTAHRGEKSMAASPTLHTVRTGEARTGELVPVGSLAHRSARVAAGLRSAARDAGVELTDSYAAKIAVDGITRCDQLGVTKLGGGVVIHTAPEDVRESPIVLGYANPTGEWLRDGTPPHPGKGRQLMHSLRHINLETPTLLTIVPWPDPVVEAHGHKPGSPYVEATWLGILGPSTTLCWQRLSRIATARPATAVDTTDLAVSLGLSESLGRNAPISRTLGRMVAFGAADRSGDTLAVRKALPDVPERMVARLSYTARLAHQHWARLALQPSTSPQIAPSTEVGL
jgi:hypothetical protein